MHFRRRAVWRGVVYAGGTTAGHSGRVWNIARRVVLWRRRAWIVAGFCCERDMSHFYDKGLQRVSVANGTGRTHTQDEDEDDLESGGAFVMLVLISPRDLRRDNIYR
jgi:hypothetical protein